jgi:hypothetical protein
LYSVVVYSPRSLGMQGIASFSLLHFVQDSLVN